MMTYLFKTITNSKKTYFQFGFGSRQNWFMSTLALRVGCRFVVGRNDFPSM